ncbi:MAG: hypothetical protein NZ937_04610 [Armatimonadetes bacterium]|nr:hypothetical protein [Armatimonadota bacterium]
MIAIKLRIVNITEKSELGLEPVASNRRKRLGKMTALQEDDENLP